MAIRTTAEKVVGIVDFDSNAGEAEVVLAPFIETAADLVDTHCVPQGLSDAKLELIERWLAGHFYACFTGQVLSETTGTVSATYLWKTGYMLNQTRQGQQAMIVDSSGALARWNQQTISGSKLSLSVNWGGSKYDSVKDSL